MRYTVVLTDEIKAKFRAMPVALRREIGHKLFMLEDDLGGDVKKLKALAMNTAYAWATTAYFSISKVEP